ncbi:MAG: type I-MYXAN CRISPR-associated protein Cas6/Cmx6 [Isosphaeraceae bacterium]|nr:type I-MYXAN CRISPR-associated protein Cas6/Cmx6 [Isosphaeraceae bacterium]
MPVIDLAFVLVGRTVPLDHGYALFGALSRVVPALHGNRSIGVHPIRGRQTAPGVLSLTESSRLRLRLPSEEVATYLAIAGAELELDGHRLRVGIPRSEPLVPASRLASRLVTFRNAKEPARFEADVRRELETLGIAGEPSLVASPSSHPRSVGQPIRRVLRIKDKRVVGFALRVGGLTAEESLKLQEAGLGGRRRMGAGVFVPIERATTGGLGAS